MIKSCKDCGEEFNWYPGKPGYINQCEECSDDVPLQGGNMIWDHKTAPYIEIKPMKDALIFAKQTSRRNCGPLTSIVQRKEPPSPAKYNKASSGAEDHAQYYSKLGEKRSVKL